MHLIKMVYFSISQILKVSHLHLFIQWNLILFDQILFSMVEEEGSSKLLESQQRRKEAGDRIE